MALLLPERPTSPTPPRPDAGEPPPSRRGGLRAWALWIGRVAYVRLRFLVVLGLAFAVVAGWDTLRNYWERLIRGGQGVDLASQAVSADTEYFCPMDPGALSDWPSKCPICNMTLVRRKRGDATPLPEGVIARMQFSPYRLQLAGIRTVPVAFRPLARSVEGPAVPVAGDETGRQAEVSLFASDLEGVSPGMKALVAGAAAEPIEGTVRSVPDRATGSEAKVVVELGQGGRLESSADPLRATILIPMADQEPFRSLPADPPPPRPGERRRVYLCPDHHEVVREASGKCPQDRKPLARRDLTENQRVRYWCPMHPGVTADAPGAQCAECGGMVLVPRVVTFRPAGQVLAVPESAVLDTGTRKVVYVERMPGMFDGVEVVLGPRCGAEYPVVRGVEAGQRVVASGAFLVDAENRLNPSVAASYFGAGSRGDEASVAAPPADDDLAPADRAIVAAQKVCPVTNKPLGSMGTPVRLEVSGRVVFVCCEGCGPAIEKDPRRYLARLPAGPEVKPAP
jgi:Cu(I)/Ag(I) efflux system membrane fusion protein